MTNYKEILRLHSLGINNTRIAESCGCARSTVISYLRESEQSIVQQFLESGVKISTGHAQILKEKSKEHELTENEIRQIIKSEPHSSKRKSIKLTDELVSKYFTEDQSSEDIERIIASWFGKTYSKDDDMTFTNEDKHKKAFIAFQHTLIAVR